VSSAIGIIERTVFYLREKSAEVASFFDIKHFVNELVAAMASFGTDPSYGVSVSILVCALISYLCQTEQKTRAAFVQAGACPLVMDALDVASHLEDSSYDRGVALLAVSYLTFGRHPKDIAPHRAITTEEQLRAAFCFRPHVIDYINSRYLDLNVSERYVLARNSGQRLTRRDNTPDRFAIRAFKDRGLVKLLGDIDVALSNGTTNADDEDRTLILNLKTVMEQTLPFEDDPYLFEQLCYGSGPAYLAFTLKSQKLWIKNWAQGTQNNFVMPIQVRLHFAPLDKLSKEMCLNDRRYQGLSYHLIEVRCHTNTIICM
jgi:hypothetical protein